MVGPYLVKCRHRRALCDLFESFEGALAAAMSGLGIILVWLVVSGVPVWHVYCFREHDSVLCYMLLMFRIKEHNTIVCRFRGLKMIPDGMSLIIKAARGRAPEL